jgi:hypothetical protein
MKRIDIEWAPNLSGSIIARSPRFFHGRNIVPGCRQIGGLLKCSAQAVPSEPAVALGETLQIDDPATVRAVADLALAVMRLDGEQHAAAVDFKDARGRDDGAADGGRGEVADVDLAADGNPARRQMRRYRRARGDLPIANIVIGVP